MIKPLHFSLYMRPGFQGFVSSQCVFHKPLKGDSVTTQWNNQSCFSVKENLTAALHEKDVTEQDWARAAEDL